MMVFILLITHKYIQLQLRIIHIISAFSHSLSVPYDLGVIVPMMGRGYVYFIIYSNSLKKMYNHFSFKEYILIRFGNDNGLWFSFPLQSSASYFSLFH